MELKTLIGQGRLAPALDAATTAVKAAPKDAPARTALFELLCFAGDLDRAEKQLDVLADESMEMAYGVALLKAYLQAERQRREVFAGNAQPEFLGEEPQWAKQRLAILAGNESPAADELDKGRVPPRGRINGREFQDLRDGDDLLAPCLEVFVGRRYIWFGWNQIRSLTSELPKTLRDTLWLPVKLKLSSGDQCDGVVPVIYAGTHSVDDEALKLGRATDWQEQVGLMRGQGRRLLYANGEEEDILALRTLEVEG